MNSSATIVVAPTRLVRVVSEITRAPDHIALQRYENRYEYLIHDRDSIFARHLDESIGRLGMRVLKSPPHCPMANAICERVIGTIRRECLDWLIPLSEAHLRSILNGVAPVSRTVLSL